MSVYKPRGSRIWHFDFQIRGKRFYGSTGQDTRRAAETVERKRRLEAETGANRDASGLTIEAAANRYWIEVGETRRASNDVKRRLQVMMTCVGPAMALADIDGPAIENAIAKRRGLDLGKGLPSPSTVNRDIIDTTLRPILNRARKAWKIQGLPEIDWASHRLAEPEPEHREYTAEQIEAWGEHLKPVQRYALHLLTTYGLRFGELFFSPDAVQGSARELIIHGKYRKRGGTISIPLTTDDARILSAMSSRARVAGLSHVLHHGEPAAALTYHGLHSALRKAAKRAGLEMGRMIHGCRHHAATRVVRQSGSLKKAQKLLGHASILSTARYAHVTNDDLRSTIDDLSRDSPEVNFSNEWKHRKSKDNS
jgi:hypothetical protein